MEQSQLGIMVKELLFAIYMYSMRENLAEDIILADVLEDLSDLYKGVE
jgi:hypothetical protein